MSGYFFQLKQWNSFSAPRLLILVTIFQRYAAHFKGLYRKNEAGKIQNLKFARNNATVALLFCKKKERINYLG
jgi:hypothetical protein